MCQSIIRQLSVLGDAFAQCLLWQFCLWYAWSVLKWLSGLRWDQPQACIEYRTSFAVTFGLEMSFKVRKVFITTHTDARYLTYEFCMSVCPPICPGAQYRWDIKILRFSTNYLLYLGNDTRWCCKGVRCPPIFSLSNFINVGWLVRKCVDI